LASDQGPVLVTGAAGFLGWYAARALADRDRTVVGTSRDGAGLPPGVEARALALDDGGAAAADLLRELRPGAVIHLAAESSADACARDPARARRINAEATGAIARAAAEVGAWLLFSSTDLVFDGTAAPYAEDDPTSPLGPYMASKVEGEAAVLAASPEHLVVRVALLYGRAGGRKGGFCDAFLRRLERGEDTPLFVDQFRTPLLVGDAAELLADLEARRPGGVLHLAGPDRVSRYEHGLILAETLGRDPALCEPVPMSAVSGLAPRPPDVSLAIDRLVALVGRSPRGVRAGARALHR